MSERKKHYLANILLFKYNRSRLLYILKALSIQSSPARYTVGMVYPADCNKNIPDN